jgi:hypothetical protein
VNTRSKIRALSTPDPITLASDSHSGCFGFCVSAKLCIPNGLRAVAAGRVVFRIAEMVIHLAFQVPSMTILVSLLSRPPSP